MGDQIATSQPVSRPLRRSRSVLFSFSLLLAAGCSGSEANSSPTDPSTTTSEPSVTDAPTTSTSSSTTTSSTTTIEPVPVVDTAPSTDETTPAPITDPSGTTEAAAPTNTTFDPSTPSGEVEQATLSNLIAFYTCLGQLPVCDIEAAIRHASLDYADGNSKLITEWNSAGYELRNADDYTFRVDEIELSQDGTEAIAFTCTWDGTALVSPASESSPEEVLDAGQVSSLDKYLVRRINDIWLVTAKDQIESAVGESSSLCE